MLTNQINLWLNFDLRITWTDIPEYHPVRFDMNNQIEIMLVLE